MRSNSQLPEQTQTTILGPHSTKVAVCQKTRAENEKMGLLHLFSHSSEAVQCTVMYVVQYVCITMYVEAQYVSSQVTWGSFKYLLLRNFQSLF